jgi:hypothetical protein
MNEAKRNIETILQVKATAEVQESVLKDLESTTPELSVAKLLNEGTENDEEETSKPKRVRSKSGKGKGRKDKDLANEADQEDDQPI